jgi:hypothetical protein
MSVSAFVLRTLAEASGIPESGAGELVEVKTVPLPPLKDALKTAHTHAEVEAIRIQRGYKAGWTRAIMAHKDKFRHE